MALSRCIDRHDPSRGARFSTWLLTIAKHTMTDELDRRNALKRGGGQKTTTLEESWSGPADGPAPDQDYEAAIFRSKVEAAVRKVEREIDFLDFQIFRLRVLDGQSGKDVADSLGMSEPTVSRRLAKARDRVRARLEETVGTFSFTQEETQEASRKGLDSNPKKVADTVFDESLADVIRRQERYRRTAQEDSL
ncbi:MAG: sigma-70 family RNA polymerase sigma factor [Planctomycetota bacterium]|nr:sigma-70 family RNA polymerase sigma factor [Planctomycetota bacterium]